MGSFFSIHIPSSLYQERTDYKMFLPFPIEVCRISLLNPIYKCEYVTGEIIKNIVYWITLISALLILVKKHFQKIIQIIVFTILISMIPFLWLFVSIIISN